MRKGRWRFWLSLLVIVGLVVAAVVFWPWWRGWLPHPALVEAWIYYLVVDLNIGRWGPVATLLLVGLIELVWALSLGRQSSAFERQWQRLERLQAKEVAVLNQEISQLKEERRGLLSELELREDLIREEKTRLWAQFEELQRSSGVSLSTLTILDAPELPPAVRGEWRQIVSQLERIELVGSASVRRGQSSLQLQQRAGELLRLGRACYYLGQYERALTHYDRAAEAAPNDPEAMIDRAVVNHALGRHQLAVQDLERALKLAETPWAYLYRGLLREHLGESKRALEDYSKALRLDSSFVEGYYRRGLLYAELGEYDKAFQDQNRVIEFNSSHAGAYAARGVARAFLGDSQWALNDLDRSCMLAPQRYEPFYHRGRVRHQLEMYEEALSDFDRAIELNPAFAPAYMARGNAYLALEKHWQAIADYSQVIELQPKNAAAFHARGKARAAMREYRRAIEDLDQALELDPGLALALADRGSAYEKLGEYELAIRDLDRAIVLAPNLAIAYYNRGLAYGSKGEYDRASRDLNRAVELDPSLGSMRPVVPGSTPA